MTSRSARFSAAFSRSDSALKIQLVRLTISYPGTMINVSRPFSAMRANSTGSLGPVADHSDPGRTFKGLPVRPWGSHTNDPQPKTAILMPTTIRDYDGSSAMSMNTKMVQYAAIPAEATDSPPRKPNPATGTAASIPSWRRCDRTFDFWQRGVRGNRAPG